MRQVRIKLNLGIFLGSILVSIGWSSIALAEHAGGYSSGGGYTSSGGGSNFAFPAGTCDIRGGSSFAIPQAPIIPDAGGLSNSPPPAPVNNTVAAALPQPQAATGGSTPASSSSTSSTPAAGNSSPPSGGNPDPANGGNPPAGGTDGKAIFDAKCQKCHTPEEVKGMKGKLSGALSHDGSAKKMPEGGAKLSDQEIQAIKTFLGV